VRIVGVKQSGSDTFGARQLLWIKTASEILNVSTFHQCVAAYASDFELLKTTLRPHGFTRYNLTRKPNRPTLASLDHAMWFHEEFRVDDWLLYEIEAHKTHGGRGYATGRIWTLNGKLVASTAQEGMAREQKPKL
jgi:acyl-CoA thioesterase II